LPGAAWSVQLYIKPFVGWLWAGALLMVCGGLLAALGARKQTETKA
jgi:cytochrome c-type biogenesis protein CcmF